MAFASVAVRGMRPVLRGVHISAPCTTWRPLNVTRPVSALPILPQVMFSSAADAPFTEPQKKQNQAFMTADPPPYRSPPIEVAQQLPRKFRELSNEALSFMATQGVFGARKERLLREIMRHDSCTWEVAREKVAAMNKDNDKHGWMVTLPYKIGIFFGFVGGFASLPMVFHRDTALWFNEHFVHEPLPDEGLEALDTIWGVGTWTWNWMEPPLGTASFLLLGLQLARAHMQKMNWKPYTEWVLNRRADRLAGLYPQYERQIVRDFSISDPWDS